MPGSGLFRVSWLVGRRLWVSEYFPGIVRQGFPDSLVWKENTDDAGFRAHRICKQNGPLGPYIDSYAAEMHGEGYAQQTSEVQIRLVTDFGRWLAKRQIQAREVTAELFQSYLRARARRRQPTGNDLPALHRLLNLLVRQGVVSVPASPPPTPAEQLQSEFCLYLQQERALASTTQKCYLTFVSDFLTECFGAGPADLSCLCAADVTGFVQSRAVAIQSRRRVQLLTTALRSFLRFARYRGDTDKDLAACTARRQLEAIDHTSRASA